MPLHPLSPAFESRRLSELIRALAIKRRLNARNSWDRPQIESLQRRRLKETADYAVAKSPFYRDLYRSASVGPDADLLRLPVVTRGQLMDRFDDWVTDPRLELPELEEHLANFHGTDGYYPGGYRILTTSGTSGRKGIFAFNGREWSALQAQLLRFMDGIGVGFRPRLKPRMRSASLFAGHPHHVSYRLGVSCDVGATNILRLPATTPLDALVEELNAFQPEWLHAYPSLASLLAGEQLRGRLRIHPRAVSTVGEVRTAEMTAGMTAAWGSRPFDMYWMTEGGVGMECEQHRLHAVDDEVLLEVVDEEDRPVRPGEVGHKVLVTSFYMRTQPLIRCEVSDMVMGDPEPCPCGRPFPVLTSIEGRSDDVLFLTAKKGGQVPVHPSAFRGPLAAERGLREYQVVARDDLILLRLVPSEGEDLKALGDRVTSRVGDELAAAGAARPRLEIELVKSIARDPQQMDKLKLVLSEKSRAAAL